MIDESSNDEDLSKEELKNNGRRPVAYLNETFLESPDARGLRQARNDGDRPGRASGIQATSGSGWAGLVNGHEDAEAMSGIRSQGTGACVLGLTPDS